MADDIFEAPTDNGSDSNDSYLEKYVGEGKKYKTVEDLAKAYANADRFIPELQNDLQATRQFMTDQFEELYTRIKSENRQEQIDQNERDDDENNLNRQAPPNGESVDENDLKARIKQTLEEVNEESKFKNNADFAQKVLVKTFGSVEAAQKAVLDKAREMEVQPSFLKQAAFTSPNAFFNLMGIKPDQRSTSTPGVRSDVNVNVMDRFHGGPKPGTYAYYRDLQQKDPRKYWTQAVQTQLMNDALKAGPDFFNS